ncbi:MAG: hypothetical protein ACI4TC_00135 [Kiritimatiellia bacterium]
METFLHSVRSSFQDLCLCLSGLVLACLLAVSVLRECRRFLCAHPWHVFLVLSVSSIYATVEARKPNGEDSEEAPARRQAAMVMRTGDGDLLPPVNGTAEPGLVIATLESTASNLTFVATWPASATFPQDVLDVYTTTNLLERWTLLESYSVAGLTAVTVTVEKVSSAAFFRIGDRTDTDGDGIPDAAELWTHGTDPQVEDSDGDGLSDREELVWGFDPTIPDRDRDADDNGVPDLDELVHGVLPEDEDADGDGVPNGLERTLGLDPRSDDVGGDGLSDLERLRSTDLGRLPAAPPDPIEVREPGDSASGPEGAVLGDFTVTVEFGSDTAMSATSVHGITHPGGTATCSSLPFASADCDTDSAYKLDAEGPRFKALSSGRFTFQLAADDRAVLRVGDDEVSAAWSQENQSGLGEPREILLAAGEERPLSLHMENDGGPGSLEMPCYGVWSDYGHARIRGWFSSEEVLLRKRSTARPGGVFADEYTMCRAEVFGGDFGGRVRFAFAGPGSLTLIKGGTANGEVRLLPNVDYTIRPGETVTFATLCRAAGLGDLTMTTTFIEDRTGKTGSSTGTVRIVSPGEISFCVTEVNLNHERGRVWPFGTGLSDGCINLRHDDKEGRMLPASTVEWRSDSDARLPACYLAGRSATVRARFDLGYSVSRVLTISAEAQGFAFAGLAERNVSFTDGFSDWVEFESTAPVVQAVASGVGTIRWKVKDSSFESRSEHPYYVILDEPQDPWSLRAGNEQNVRPAFLDVACGAAAGESAKPAALAKLTQHLFSGRGYLYEYHTGGSRRWDEDGPFDLSGYLFDDTPSFFGNPREVNCFDQGCGLAFLARAIGIDVDVEQVSNSDERLYIKESLIVGLGSETDNPFYRSGAPRCCSHRLCGSELHAEGVSRSSFTKHVYVLYGGRVFDACMGPCLGTQTRQSYFADRFEPGQILDTSTLGVSCGVK